MQTQQLGATTGVAVAAEQGEASSSAGLRPGSPDTFAHFHPQAAGPLVPLSGNEDAFFDARSSFSSVEASDLPNHDEVEAQHRSLRALLPDLMSSLASLRDGAADYLKAKAKQMADHSTGASANIEAKRQLAEEHGCQLVFPFHQTKFIFDKTIEDGEFRGDYGRAGGSGHACFGLSTNWCQSRAKGQTDEAFFDKLTNHREDALLARVLGFQHVEQQAFTDKIRNAGPMLRETLPKLGMALAKGPDGNRDAHYHGVMLQHLDRDLSLVLKPGQNQTFLLLSQHHAMALHQDEQSRLHFFDPLFGVVQADTRQQMTAFLGEAFERDARTHWSDGSRRLQLSELQPGPAFHLR